MEDPDKLLLGAVGVEKADLVVHRRRDKAFGARKVRKVGYPSAAGKTGGSCDCLDVRHVSRPHADEPIAPSAGVRVAPREVAHLDDHALMDGEICAVLTRISVKELHGRGHGALLRRQQVGVSVFDLLLVHKEKAEELVKINNAITVGINLNEKFLNLLT